MIFITDTSCFLSVESLQDLIKVLRYLKEQEENRNGMKVLIPSSLYPGLEDMERGIVPSSLKEIFSTWLNSNGSDEGQEHPEYNINNLVDNAEYKRLLGEFKSSFTPERTEEFLATSNTTIPDEEAHKFITRNEIREKLPSHATNVLYEELFTSAKSGAGIINFGHRLKNILVNFGKKVKEMRSEFKEKIKNRTNIRSALRISFVVISIAATGAIISATHGTAAVWSEMLRGGIQEGLNIVFLNG